MDEYDLLKRIIQGEHSLFRILVEKYKDVALTVAYSIVKNQETAEDVTQNAFIKAFKSLPKFGFQSSFKTWFYRIVVNTSYHTIEKRKVRKQAPINDHSLNAKTQDLNGYETMLVKERKEIILAVLTQLKTNEALLLKLYYLGEQSQKEISEVLGMSLSNVKVTMLRARKNFHHQLELMIGTELNELL